MIGFLSDNWIIFGLLLLGVLLGLLAGKFYKKRNAKKVRADEADMMFMQNWYDADIFE